MAIKLTSTKDAKTQGVKVLVYGKAGSGKTTLISTAPKPIIISFDRGLSAISDYDYPVMTVTSLKKFKSAIKFIIKNKNKYRTVCVDDITGIAKKILRNEKQNEPNLWTAYGNLADKLEPQIDKLVSINGIHVYVIAKLMVRKDDDEINIHCPSMPGNILPEALPYMFDEVFALRIFKGDPEEDERDYRYLQTQPTDSWDAKDRSGKLKPKEKPNLTYIFNKIMKVKKNKK